MDFERLGEVWRREVGPEHGRTPDQELDAVRARAAGLERAVHRRDYLETGAALVLLPFFMWLAVTVGQPVSAIGAAIVAGACVLVPIRLYMARRRAPDSGLPVALALREELRRVRVQERLLGSVVWWYLAPFGVGVILFVAGLPVSTGSDTAASAAVVVAKIAYAIAVVALYGYILRLNHRAARDQFAPVAHQLERWLANLDESSDAGVSDAD